MAKVSSVQKNLNRRELVKKFKNKRKNLKKKIMQKSITIEERLKSKFNKDNIPNVIKTSWLKATIAPTPNCHSNLTQI